MSPLSRVRILVTEDDPDTLDLLEIILAHANCEVVTTGSSSQALALARTRAFDLYLLDSWMAEMGGVELCQKLRALNSKIPILYYSAYGDEADHQHALQTCGDAYLKKPVCIADIQETIARLLANAQETE